MIIYLLAETCQVRADFLGKMLLKISELLPDTPYQFRIAYLIDQINGLTPWGLGGVITELLSGILDYCKLVLAWKITKMLIGILGSRL